MPNPKIKIDVDPSAVPGFFNFTFTPTTLHVPKKGAVDFGLGRMPPGSRLTLVFFEGGPFNEPGFEVPPAGTSKTVASGPGAYHYGAILNDKTGKIEAHDLYCPSIIVH